MRKISAAIICCSFFIASCSSNSEKQAESDSTATVAANPNAPDNQALVDTNATNTALPDSSATGTSGAAKATAEAKAASTEKAGSIKTAVIEINTVPEAMQYDKKSFTVRAGQKVIINFNNPDSQQHNLVILQVGAFNKAGAAANEMAADPKGLEKNYIPQIPEVLHSTPLLAADGSYTLEFTAPSKIGDYPYICTFPGHWAMMNGIMQVIK